MSGIVTDLRIAAGDWFKRLGWAFVVTDDETTELGFMPADVSWAKRAIEATGVPADLLLVAMDAARYYREPLVDTVMMVIGAYLGKTRDLRRSGFESFSHLRAGVKGQAKAYSKTIFGQGEVHAARRARAEMASNLASEAPEKSNGSRPEDPDRA